MKKRLVFAAIVLLVLLAAVNAILLLFPTGVAKTAVIDGAWSTIGSANIDRRSFIHNYELNVVVIDPAFGRDMENAFNEDLRKKIWSGWVWVVPVALTIFLTWVEWPWFRSAFQRMIS